MSGPPEPAPGWPAYPPTDTATKELAAALYSAELTGPKSRLETLESRYRSQFDTEAEMFKNFHTTLRDLAKASASRVDSLSQLIQTAAGAIVTLYTGVLAVVFAADGIALPLRALVPAVFLGLAIVFAAAYAAFLTPVDDTPYLPTSMPRENVLAQTKAVLNFVRVRNNTRSRAIRSAVVSLGLGVLFLPSAFISIASATPPAPSTPYPEVPAAAPADALPDLWVARYQAELTEIAELRAEERNPARQPATFELFGLPIQVADALITGLAFALALLGFLVAFFVRVPKATLRGPSAPGPTQGAPNPPTSGTQ